MAERGMVHEACKWCYSGVWGVLTRYFHLPKEPPNLPSMEGEKIEFHHPSQAFLEYQKFLFWIGLFAIDIALTFAWIVIAVVSPLVGLLITPIALAIIVLPDIVAYIAIHLRYDTTWYVLSDRSLRIRRGIWTIHETTITFENIQNIQLQQGPLQRWFGFANLVVKTAGGSHSEGAPLGAHVGVLEGLANANELREQILARTRRSTGAGLGDEHPDELHAANRAQRRSLSNRMSGESLAVLREIRDLAKELAA